MSIPPSLLELVQSTTTITPPPHPSKCIVILYMLTYGSVADFIDVYIKIGKNLGLRMP